MKKTIYLKVTMKSTITTLDVSDCNLNVIESITYLPIDGRTEIYQAQLDMIKLAAKYRNKGFDTSINPFTN